MSKKYMLDTNIASMIIKGVNEKLAQHLLSIPMEDIVISAITEAELLFGIAHKPEAIKLKLLVHEFLIRLDVLPWGSEAAEAYAKLCADCTRSGTALGNLDMLIAAHAISVEAILVTHDQAFYKVKPRLSCVDWTR